jgi:hypothetical protein
MYGMPLASWASKLVGNAGICLGRSLCARTLQIAERPALVAAKSMRESG